MVIVPPVDGKAFTADCTVLKLPDAPPPTVRTVPSPGKAAVQENGALLLETRFPTETAVPTGVKFTGPGPTVILAFCAVTSLDTNLSKRTLSMVRPSRWVESF